MIRSRSKLNRCETTSRRWFSLIRIKLLIRISWCSVNARKGAKPVSLRIKSASVNGVFMPVVLLHSRSVRLSHLSHQYLLLACGDFDEHSPTRKGNKTISTPGSQWQGSFAWFRDDINQGRPGRNVPVGMIAQEPGETSIALFVSNKGFSIVKFTVLIS